MRKWRMKELGPIKYFRVREKGKDFLSAWLTKLEGYECGWEWGYDDMGTNPSCVFRLAHLNIFYYERLDHAHLVYVLGFWVML